MAPDPDDVPEALRRGLREEVLRLREGASLRLRRPTGLYAGTPGGPQAACDPAVPEHAAGELDPGLRTSITGTLLERALERCAAPALWLVRSGTCDWHDEDAAWCGPALRAGAELGVAVRFVVVTPQGWRDPVSGAGRAWARLRRHH